MLFHRRGLLWLGSAERYKITGNFILFTIDESLSKATILDLMLIDTRPSQLAMALIFF